MLEALGALHAADAVVAIVAKLSPESELVPSVRAAALGEIGDAAARAAVQAASADDTGLFVRGAATIALRRL